jgi:PBSX family phage terminase large subunit
MKLQVTNAFHKLQTAHDYKLIGPDNKKLIGFEGGSSAGKTHAIIPYLLLYSQHNYNKGKIIRIFRDDRVNCMGSVYEDFMERIKAVGQFSEANLRKSAPTTYHHFGNRFQFMGLDDAAKVHGPRQNVSYFNEVLDVDKDSWKQVNMRTAELTIMDWNPKCTEHWVFDLEKLDNAIFVHATFRDNAFLQKSIVDEILALEPTEKNKEAGTSDEYLYKVYNLGVRASHQGLVFPNVTWIDEFPEDIEDIGYAVDFGHTNHNTAIIKGGRSAKNLYFKKLFYSPCDDIPILEQVIKNNIGEFSIVGDCAEPGMITDLQMRGIPIYGVNKFNGSVNYGITLMHGYNIHLVRDKDVRKEHENYKWREVNGIKLNEPVKQFDDFWDACRYLCLSIYRQ